MGNEKLIQFHTHIFPYDRLYENSTADFEIENMCWQNWIFLRNSFECEVMSTCEGPWNPLILTSVIFYLYFVFHFRHLFLFDHYFTFHLHPIRICLIYLLIVIGIACCSVSGSNKIWTCNYTWQRMVKSLDINYHMPAVFQVSSIWDESKSPSYHISSHTNQWTKKIWSE